MNLVDLYTKATRLAMSGNQVEPVGSEYFITLRQLECLIAEAPRQPSADSLELADKIVTIVYEEVDRDGDWMHSREFAVERVQNKLAELRESRQPK